MTPFPLNVTLPGGADEPYLLSIHIREPEPDETLSMKIVRLLLLSGGAVAGMAATALADDLLINSSGIPPLDTSALAREAAPTLPDAASALTLSKGTAPVVPGLPLSAREKAAFGDSGSTLKVQPSANGEQGGTLSWSGYVRAGVVYKGGN